MWLHLHVASWALALVLFVIRYSTMSSGNKGLNTVLYILVRFLFVCILVTGITLLVQVHFEGWAVVKGVLSVILIGLLEMLMARRKRRKSTKVLWFLTVLDLVIVVYIGSVVLK